MKVLIQYLPYHNEFGQRVNTNLHMEDHSYPQKTFEEFCREIVKMPGIVATDGSFMPSSAIAKIIKV